jgi:MFS family permease
MPPLIRNRFTWQAYLIMGWFSYIQAAPGPLMPFLSDELGLDYTASALHTSSFAVGLLLSGFFGDSLTNRFGRNRVVWVSSTGVIAGVLLLTLGQHPAVTISGTFFVGMAGILMIIPTQSALVDQHPHHRTAVLVELGAMGGAMATLAPLLIGNLERIGIGWRAALWLALAAGLLLAAWSTRQPPIRSVSKQKLTDRKPLPPIFWVYWLVLFLGIATSWCISFWGADFLDKEVGLETELAATLMSVMFAATVIGRLAVSQLSRRFSAERLLLGGVILALAGFPLFWLAPVAPLNIVGLFISGLGVGTFIGLTLAAAMIAIPDQVDAISARTATGGGLAILIMPQTLGTLADVVGIKNAFGLILVTLLLMLAVLIVLNQRQSQPAQQYS